MTKVLLLANSIGKILSAIEIIELHQSSKAIAKVLWQLYLNDNTILVHAHGDNLLYHDHKVTTK